MPRIKRKVSAGKSTDEMEVSCPKRDRKRGVTSGSEDEEVFPPAPKNKHEISTDELYEQDDRKKAFFELITGVIEQGTLVITEDLIERLRFYMNNLHDEDMESKHSQLDFPLRQYVVNVMSKSWAIKKNFLELIIRLAREELCTAALPITAIQDMVELIDQEECIELFDFVETHLDIWKDPFFTVAGKISVLRMCNDLLRRQSRSQNTTLCGRILLFLSNYFPFSERSGLNIMSEFNVSDTLSIADTDEDSDDLNEDMDTEQEVKLFEGMDIQIPGLDKIVSISQEQKKKKLEVDYNLYVKFWSIQEYFRNPLQCYNKLNWKTFISYTQDVLNVYSSFKLDATSCATRRYSEVDLTSKFSSHLFPKLGNESFYFPKYLTNRRVLEFQMSDSSFRRYFMVQLLMVLQYLTLNVKFKTESQTLTEDQLEVVKTISDQVYTLLEETPPDGAEFVKAIQRTLEREELWNKWKNDGCQPFKKPVNSGISTDERDKLGTKDDIDEVKGKQRRSLGDIIKEAEENGRILMGNSELTRLWNISTDNLEACRSKGRDFMPSIETFFAEAFKELDFDSASQSTPGPSPKEPRVLSDANFGWRALRILSRRSPHFFQMFSGSPIHPLENYLEYLLKKIVADKEPIPSPSHQIDESVKKQEALDEPIEDKVNNQATDTEAQVEVEGNMDEDEILNPTKDEECGEEGEVHEKIRNLTDEEQSALGTKLETNWSILAAKLGFAKDEVDFFLTEHKENAAAYMLKMWTEQEGDDATVADLLYILEGLKLKDCAEGILF